MLSRNAKLFMLSTVLQGFSSGIWSVIFYLYLKLGEVGFRDDFIGNMFTVSALATGFVALPAGLIIERLGTKKALIISMTANFINIVQIVVLQPSILLLASLVAGLIGTIGWVASAPFMTENSTREERTYLFSISWATMIVMGILGNLAGGFMPSIFNSYLGSASGTVSAFGYRLALLISMVLALVAAIPLLLMKQAKRKERTMSEILNFKNIKSSKIMLKLALPVGLIGFGAGFIVPLLNLFFAGKFAATTEEIGILNALSNVTLVVGTLAAPVMSRKLGKVKAIALCEFLSMPFIMLMTLSPVLPLAGFAFVTRNALMNMAGPVSGTFQMEMVTETERATTNGLLVTADNIPRAITASVSGGMMASGDYFTPFLATTCSYLFASSLFYFFFRNAESRKPVSQASNVS